MKSAVALSLALAGCFGSGESTSASKEQLERFLRECGIAGARIEDEGGRTGTKWVVALGEQPQAKWNCFESAKARAGVMATTWGRVKDDM